MKTIQMRIESPDLCQDELNKMADEMVEMQLVLREWAGRAPDMATLMDKAHITIKDRQSRRPLYFNMEIQNLVSSCDRANTQIQSQQGKLDDVSRQWKDFDNRKQALLGAIDIITQQVESVTVTQSSVKGIQDWQDQIRAYQGQLEAVNPDYEELRELGRQLMVADNSHMSLVQEAFTMIDQELEHVEGMTGGQLQTAGSVLAVWQQYTDTTSTVSRLIHHLQPLLQQQDTFNSQRQLKQALDKHKASQ